MKKALKIIFSIILSFAVMWSSVSVAMPFSLNVNAAIYGGLEYSVNSDGEATIEGRESTLTGRITIPESINGYPVVYIGGGPYGISGAFCNDKKITEIIFPKSLRVIEHTTFYDSGLIKVSIPKTVEKVEYGAFRKCNSLTEAIISEGVTVDYEAFLECYNLSKVTIGKGVSLDYHVFKDCRSLTKVSLAKGIKRFGDGVFTNCVSLMTIEIPEGITAISTEMFMNCTKLENVTLPKGITIIGAKAFNKCTSLKEIVIPKSVLRMDKEAFLGCSALEAITLREGITSIGDSAFSQCSKLKDVYYYGSEESWNAISIGSGNDNLKNAEIHFLECEHKNTTEYEKEDATCTENGYTAGTYCYDCEKFISGHEEIAAFGHLEETVKGTAATCTEMGWTDEVKCSVCGEILVKKEVIEAFGHDAVAIEGKGATCIDSGLTDGSVCVTCSNVIKAQKEIPVLGHDEKTKVTEPTCTEQGFTTHTCTRCDYNVVDTYINATGHSERIIYGKDATCTETGITKGSECYVCGEVLEEQTEIDARGHDLLVEVTDPTCTEDGYTTHSCSRCYYEVVDTYTAALDHDYVGVITKEPTCTSNGTETFSCSRCSKSYFESIPKTAHVYGEWIVTKEPTVQSEGKETRTCVCGRTETRQIDRLPEETTTQPPVTTLIGDLNGDGKITAADARIALRIAAKLDAGTPEQMTAADMNGDGKVNAADARLILRKSAKLD